MVEYSDRFCFWRLRLLLWDLVNVGFVLIVLIILWWVKLIVLEVMIEVIVDLNLNIDIVLMKYISGRVVVVSLSFCIVVWMLSVLF